MQNNIKGFSILANNYDSNNIEVKATPLIILNSINTNKLPIITQIMKSSILK